MRAEALVIPFVDFVPASAAGAVVSVPLVRQARGVLVGEAGTVNVTMQNGSVRTGLPLQAGYTPMLIQSIQAGGTATGVWAAV